MQACNCQGICMYHFRFQWISIYQLYFLHSFSFPRSSIDTNFFQCLPIYITFFNWFQGRSIGNLQALLTLAPYTNPYRSTDPPTFQWTVALIKKKMRLFRIVEASSSLDWVVNEATALSSQPPPPPTPPPRLVSYYLYFNHLIDKGQYFQLDAT